MRGKAATLGSVDILVRAVLEEFPELDGARVRAAVERGVARAASASLDTEGYRVVDLHLAKVEATEESSERARILRDLSATLEERDDADRALVVRLSAFGEAAEPGDVEVLLRLARITERYDELPLDTMNALIDIHEDGAADRLSAMATAWQKVGRPYYAADCLERVLLVKPDDDHAHETLELFYRSTSEWPVLVDLLHRRTIHVHSDKQRAELFREIGVIYERELGDPGGALDAYREADRLAPGHPDALAAMARLSVGEGAPEEEALDALERLAKVTTDQKQRADVLRRAAEHAKLTDWDRAARLFEQSRADDPDLPATVDGFVQLLRDQGKDREVIALLLEAAARPAMAKERSRWLTEAADYTVGLGDTTGAVQLYLQARKADPDNHKAGVALVELCIDTGALVDLAPILDKIIRTTDDPARLRRYLMTRSKIAMELGDKTGARSALSRAVDLDPADTGARKELADMLFEAGQWAKARPMLESLLEDEDLLSPERRVEVHFRIAKCAHHVGDKDSADKHLDIALAIEPTHRESLQLKTELAGADPFAYAASQLALANLAPPEEKAQRFADLGDRYTELGDNATAREMYREALAHRPGDHLLLTKFLGLVTSDGDWSYSLDVIQRLVDTEKDPKVRARYRHLGGMIARDELDDHEQAVALFQDALHDDPFAFNVADELEQLLASVPDVEPLVRFYYKRLKDVQNEEGRPNERLRLWDQLGELCLQSDRNDDAVTAFEVALTLAPDDADRDARRQRLADLYFGNAKYDQKAIAQHQAVLRGDKRRIESYKALRDLYERTKQPEKMRAVEEALEIVNSDPSDKLDKLFAPGASHSMTAGQVKRAPLTNEDFVAISKIDVDLALTALFSVVAPPFGVERARMRPPAPVPTKEHEPPATAAAVLARVVTALGVKKPPVYLDRELSAACTIAMRARDGVLTPVLTLGRAALDKTVDENELAFHIARALADLRNERIARLLVPRAGELAQIIELASAPANDASHANRWLATSLHPVELAQARAIGARLREKTVHPMTAALGWLAATDRAADRIAFAVVGDLGACARLLEKETVASSTDTNRTLELAWSSITEEMLAVRGRIEGWLTPASEPRRKTTTFGAVEPR